jgi:hypothetical protein
MKSIVSDSNEPRGGWKMKFTFSDWLGWIHQGDRGRTDKMADAHKVELEDRLDNVGWGLLFLLLGALALPTGTVEYASAASVGGAMLGLNALRIVFGVPVRWFSILLGTVMLVAGGGALAGTKMDVFVLFFVLAGVVTIAGAAIGPRRVTAQ